MNQLSSAASAESRKILSTILQRLASVGQSPTAQALGVSDATVSRLKSEQLNFFSMFLSVLRLKVVPVEVKCYKPEYIEHLRFFASRGFDHQEGDTISPTSGDDAE